MLWIRKTWCALVHLSSGQAEIGNVCEEERERVNEKRSDIEQKEHQIIPNQMDIIM